MADDIQQRVRRSSTAVYVLSGLLVLGIVAVIAVVLLTQTDDNDERDDSPPAASSADGINALDEPRAIPDFTLPASSGGDLSLSDLEGQLVLLYFGYLHCPDFCPETMLDYREIHRQLGDQAGDVAFVFISVDGERDTPDLLDRFLRRFDPAFIGMQGNPAVLDEIAGPFNLSYSLNKRSEDDSNYSVDHTASKFLLDREGNLTHIISFSTPPDVVTATIEAQLES